METLIVLAALAVVVLLFVLAELRKRRPVAVRVPYTPPIWPPAYFPKPGLPCSDLHHLVPPGRPCPVCGRRCGAESVL